MDGAELITEDLEPRPVAVGYGSVVCASRRSPAKDTPNEDALLVLSLGDSAVLLAVADGCGGMPGGGRAALAALEALERAVGAADDSFEARTAGVLAGFDDANRAVLDLRLGAGTTVAACLVHGGVARPFHAGDSTIMITGQRGRVRFETIAHSPTGYAVEAGLLSEREAIVHDDRSLILNHVGSEDMRVDVGPPVRLNPHDTVLLGSDGLTDNLIASEVRGVIRSGELRLGVGRLMSMAGERMGVEDGDRPGHPDDLTLVAFRLR